MTVADWITIAVFVLGAMGVLLKAQHSLITRLLSEKWQDHERRIESQEDSLHALDLRVTTVETICHMRKNPRTTGA